MGQVTLRVRYITLDIYSTLRTSHYYSLEALPMIMQCFEQSMWCYGMLRAARYGTVSAYDACLWGSYGFAL